MIYSGGFLNNDGILVVEHSCKEKIEDRFKDKIIKVKDTSSHKLVTFLRM